MSASGHLFFLLKMRSLQITLLAFIICSGCFHPLHSQKKWSLEECINFAHKNNLDILQQELAVKQQKTATLRYAGEYIPTLNILLDRENFTIQSNLTIFAGLQRYNNIRYGRTGVEISEQQRENLKMELSIAITKVFLQLLLDKELLDVAKRSYQTTSDQLQRTKLFVQEGRQSYSTLLDIESHLAGEMVQITNCQNNIKKSTLELTQLMNIEYCDTLIISPPVFIFDPLSFASASLDSIYSNALNLPSIKAAELLHKQGRYKLAATIGAATPTFSLFANYNSFYKTDSEPLKVYGFELKIPILNNYTHGAAISRAKLDYKYAEVELEKEKQQLYKDIQSDLFEARALYQKYTAAQKALIAMEESFRYCEEKFNAGILSSTDYNTQKSNLLKMNSDVLQSKHQFFFQLKILEFYGYKAL